MRLHMPLQSQFYKKKITPIGQQILQLIGYFNVNKPINCTDCGHSTLPHSVYGVVVAGVVCKTNPTGTHALHSALNHNAPGHGI